VTARSVVRALAGGLGIVAGIVACAVLVAALLVALGLPPESRADDPPPTTVVAEPPPNELVVALGLGDPTLQAGVVRDGEVILARGLEVDIARNLARRLGIPHVRFVYVTPATRLPVANVRPWDLALSSIRPGGAAAAKADLSDPYLSTDQAVVLRRGLPRFTTLGDLRRKITCAVRGSAGARAIVGLVSPLVKPILASSEARLLELVQTGACDAALVDADSVGQFVAGRGGILGPVSARVAVGGGYVVAVTRDGPIAVSEVDRALARMRADGTMHRLARQWLGIDPARLLPLR
jgi:ABC-type amino acid transport substrate-binding protein